MKSNNKEPTPCGCCREVEIEDKVDSDDKSVDEDTAAAADKVEIEDRVESDAADKDKIEMEAIEDTNDKIKIKPNQEGS